MRPEAVELAAVAVRPRVRLHPAPVPNTPAVLVVGASETDVSTSLAVAQPAGAYPVPDRVVLIAVLITERP